MIVVQPMPEGNQKAGEVFARVARRYVNQKRDFLVKKELAQGDAPKLAELCGGEDAIEGVLFLKPALKPVGDGFEAELWVRSRGAATDARRGLEKRPAAFPRRTRAWWR